MLHDTLTFEVRSQKDPHRSAHDICPVTLLRLPSNFYSQVGNGNTPWWHIPDVTVFWRPVFMNM
ncbi:MAG: hypothetical protein IPI42_08675 [Saprospiraceae bacterium]|nr:hypothetical protein [Candidatus Parvibacillus calidus]